MVLVLILVSRKSNLHRQFLYRRLAGEAPPLTRGVLRTPSVQMGILSPRGSVPLKAALNLEGAADAGRLRRRAHPAGY